MKKRLSQDIEYLAATSGLSEDEIDLIQQHICASVPNTIPPSDKFRPTFSYYIRTDAGRLIVFIAIIALVITALPSILAGRVTLADAIRLPIAIIVILAGVFATPARHTASQTILRFSAIILMCAAFATPFILLVLKQPTKLAVLWPVLIGLFVIVFLTTIYLISIPIRHSGNNRPSPA